MAIKFKAGVIIDDDSAPVGVFLRFLSNLGWEAAAVSTGKDALRIFKPGYYDLVLCDVQLGDMSGIAVAKLLRLDESSLMIIIIGKSGQFRSGPRGWIRAISSKTV